MAHLHSAAGKPGEQLAIHHHARADARAQRHRHCRAAALGRAAAVFPDGGAVGIVAQEHGHIPLPLEQLPHRGVLKGHVGGTHYDARLVVHLAGQADTHRPDLLLRHAPGLAHLLCQPDDLPAQLLRGLAVIHWVAGLVQYLAVLVHQTGHQVGPAYVYTHIIHVQSSSSGTSPRPVCSKCRSIR